jgi:GNAT superfamily N-acetyltransferase
VTIRLHRIESLATALALAPELEDRAVEFHEQFSDEPFPEGAIERFLRQHFSALETHLLVAEEALSERRVGLCLVGPFVDPLLGTRLPLVLLLHVEPAFRHRGLAGKLVQRATELCAERGMPRLAARAAHNDDALISMGERWGFVRLWELMLRE